MYQINCTDKFEFDLKVVPFDKRYTMLSNNNEKNKIVYIKNQFDNSTFRYRTHNFIQSIENSNKYEIIYFLPTEINKILNLLKNISLIIFQRASWTIEIENLLYLASLNNILTIYDMDDLLFQTDHVPSYLNHIGVNFTKFYLETFFAVAAGYDMVAKKCDAYITTTLFLKEQLEKTYKKPVYVVHNFLNNEQIEASTKAMKTRKYDKSKFIIGYFSGSDSHRNDLRVAENDLIKLLEKYDDIYIKIVGFMDFTGKLREYQDAGRIIFRELVPYQQLQYEIAEVDVNIIPLVDNDFNQSKSELKFFEAGIVKVPSCVTPTNLYQEIINNQENGIFCSQGEWFNNLEKLYLDRNLLKQIGENAYQTTKKLYFPKHHKTTIENVYDELLKQK